MIQEVPYSQVAHWRHAAAKDRTSIADSIGARWFQLDYFGCAGLTPVGKGLRIKGVYIAPWARGKGHGSTLTDYLIDLAKQSGAEFIEAYAWNPAFYTARGFQEIGKNRFGAVKVRLVLS